MKSDSETLIAFQAGPRVRSSSLLLLCLSSGAKNIQAESKPSYEGACYSETLSFRKRVSLGGNYIYHPGGRQAISNSRR